jgi:hypothetical protein
VAYFWSKAVWPFIVQQVKDSKDAILSANKELTQQRGDFLIALREQTERLAGEIHNRDEALVKALSRQEEALNYHARMLLEAITRRDAAQSRTAETLELIYNKIERIERRPG